MTSMLEQERQQARAEGYKAGVDWGRQLAQCAGDNGYQRGLCEGSSKATDKDRRLQFLKGALFGIVLGALWLGVILLYYGGNA